MRVTSIAAALVLLVGGSAAAQPPPAGQSTRSSGVRLKPSLRAHTCHASLARDDSWLYREAFVAPGQRA